MTVRIYPAPQTPGHAFRRRDIDDCEVCANGELMVLSRLGSPLGHIVRCPACTRTGVAELERFVDGDGDAA